MTQFWNNEQANRQDRTPEEWNLLMFRQSHREKSANSMAASLRQFHDVDFQPLPHLNPVADRLLTVDLKPDVPEPAPAPTPADLSGAIANVAVSAGVSDLDARRQQVEDVLRELDQLGQTDAYPEAA